MRYLDRFKARQQQVAGAYRSESDVAPKRPLEGDVATTQPVNILVDVILACRMRGLDFDALTAQAVAWADYEWEQVEPLVEAARAARAQQPAAA